MLGIDIDAVTLAGAFLLGTVFGTVATLRITRALTHFFVGVNRRLTQHERGNLP